MCGICGIFNLTPDGGRPDAELLRRMVGSLDHRGPDQRGGYLDSRAALGHARLSIIDLAGGAQPMCNEDATCWLVFNGEIYNYLELGEELRGLGHSFRTRSDSEVILHAYEQWGVDCVERFNGQFAFAVWDMGRRRLMLARDRVGIRPLYYARVAGEGGGRLLFGSEIKALFQDPALPRALDPVGLAQVFTFWAPVAPRTAFEGVSQVRPGSVMVLDQAGGERERVYWRPGFLSADRPRTYANDRQVAEAAEELRASLEQATRLRMLRADVPVGAYLSGGIDSSVIGALVRRFHDGDFRTFSLRFDHQDFDEGDYQQLMVDHLRTDHQSVTVGYRDIAAAFPEVVWFAEAPMLRSAPAPLYLLSGLVREQGFKVVLTGEGADEFLAGYDIFREAKVRRFWARSPGSALRPQLLDRLYPWLARSPARVKALQRAFFGKGLDRAGEPHFSHLPRWESAASLMRLFSPDTKQALEGEDVVQDLLAALPPEAHTWEPLGQAQYLEITTLLSGYLLSSQGDRMLMGHSVEGRFPFLDHNVMELACAMPPEVKLRALCEKHVLKEAARDLVPPGILRRDKQPYRAPDAQSFVQDDAPGYVEEVLSLESLEQAGIFAPRPSRMLLEKCRRMGEKTPSNADNMALLGLISTQLLHRQLVEGKGPVGGAGGSI